jgi:hypothetical protein
MSLISDIRQIRPYLVVSARNSIIMSMLMAWHNCRIYGRKQPEEPDFIASLVLNGTRFVKQSWETYLEAINVKFALTGIYCHQTPKVSYEGMEGNSCELGDLLWCHIHQKNNRDILRNAILYQAKISQFPIHKINRNEMDQLISVGFL